MSNVDFSECNITVVDDDPLIREMLVDFLEELGVQNIFQAENGEEGLNHIVRDDLKTDLIICDLAMPKMDGFEFVSNLRSNDNYEVANTPVLILTGHIEMEKVKKAVELGIHGYLKKPVMINALEQKMIRAQTAPPISRSRLAR